MESKNVLLQWILGMMTGYTILLILYSDLHFKVFFKIQGSSIRTFGRANIFWGRGELAQKTAGYMVLGELKKNI